MDPNQITTLETLFHALVEIPRGAERDAAALRLSNGDADLARKALDLVESDEKSEAANSSARQAVAAPRNYGVYRTIRLLGTGGMGAVYLAERADGQFEQTVAVKVIAPHAAGEAFRERFLSERQILAGLSHPNITRLLDGGVTTEGTPYLAMEYVEGLPLDSYCDANKLGLRDRLELFLKVCAPVAYAHRNLVVHRDLKPSNILVTADGQPMLVDFGTAKLLVGENNATATSPLLTIRYSSPEQRSRAPISTSTDIFSLGVILYELLTGAWPFGDPSSPGQMLERFARETPMTSPQTAVTVEASLARSSTLRSLKGLLAGDLSNILTKALAPAPDQRYESVEAFSADIGNWLAGMPVNAKPPSFAYRSGKFLRRHWLPSAAVAVLITGLFGATLFSIQQANLARAQARKAENVNRFLNDTLSSASSGKFDPLKYTVAHLIDDAAAQVGDRWKNDPLTEAAVRLSLGESYTRLNRRPEAQAQLTRAVELLRASGDDQLIAQAMSAMADFWADGGNHDLAISSLREALAHLNRLGRRADPESVFWVKNYLAWHLAWMRRNPEESRVLFREAIDLGKRTPAIAKSWVSEVETHQGDLLMAQGKVAEAKAVYTEALRTGRQQDPGGYWERIPIYALSWVEFTSGNYPVAADWARQGYELYLRYSGDENPYTAAAKIRWARYRVESGATPESAIKDVTDAFAVLHRGFSETADGLREPYGHASRVFTLAKRHAEAESFARAGLTVMDVNGYAQSDDRRAGMLRHLGDALRGEKRYQEAIAAYTQAESIYAQIPASRKSLEQVRAILKELR